MTDLPESEPSLHCLDLHAAGEPCRVLRDARFDAVPGATMRERLDYVKIHLDVLRRAVMHEPRGHEAMFGSILMPPATPDADVGVLYICAGGYLDMCVHGTICTCRAAAELGLPLHNPDRVVIDAVCGRIIGELQRDAQGRAKTVTIQNVPSFVYTPEPVMLEVAGLPCPVPAHVVFAGNFFVLVDYAALEQEPALLEAHPARDLQDLGIAIRDAANAAVKVAHPANPSTNEITLTVLYERKGDAPKHMRNAVVFGEGQMDRSPCGSGTSALMTLLHHLGELELNQQMISESYIGSVFHGELRAGGTVGPYRTVIPRITGQAFLTGRSEFFREPDDPFRSGFCI